MAFREETEKDEIMKTTEQDIEIHNCITCSVVFGLPKLAVSA